MGPKSNHDATCSGRNTGRFALLVIRQLGGSYANLAMAHAAVSSGASVYGRTHFMIRSRLYSGLRRGTMNTGSLVEDDRLKMVLPQACSYCGGRDNLSVDHLIARASGGLESGDNIVWACRDCNSAKGSADLLTWMRGRDEFPPLLLLRRYLKLAIDWVRTREMVEVPLADADKLAVPFAIGYIPHKYPAPTKLRLWVTSLDSGGTTEP